MPTPLENLKTASASESQAGHRYLASPREAEPPVCASLLLCRLAEKCLVCGLRAGRFQRSGEK
jgi:hypothetical protein